MLTKFDEISQIVAELVVRDGKGTLVVFEDGPSVLAEEKRDKDADADVLGATPSTDINEALIVKLELDVVTPSTARMPLQLAALSEMLHITPSSASGVKKSMLIVMDK
jgi:hypothetical protein